MKTNTNSIYSVPNASCLLRIIEHLRRQYKFSLDSIATINLIDRWLIQIKLKSFIANHREANLRAFLNEMGYVFQPSERILAALASLNQGESPTKVMNRYQLAIVSYGKPETEEIEIFRDGVVDKLGYCPENMA